jgi:hypothetical protein
MGSARVSRAGFGVSPKRTFLHSELASQSIWPPCLRLSGFRNPISEIRNPPCSPCVILHSDAASRLRVFRTLRGWVAQLVEQRTENPRVGGSIPSPATISTPTRFQLRFPVVFRAHLPDGSANEWEEEFSGCGHLYKPSGTFSQSSLEKAGQPLSQFMTRPSKGLLLSMHAP